MHRRQQLLPILRGVVDPEKAGLRQVHLEPAVGPARRGQPQPGLRGVHHNRRRHRIAAAAIGHADRHLPHRILRLPFPQQMVIDKPLLGKGQFLPLPRGLRPHRHHRIAGLGNPAVHQSRHRLLGNGFHGRPQIPGAGIGVLIGFQILMQPLAKDLRSQKLLQHPNDRGPLAVADGVKKLADFRRVVDFLLNGMGVLEAVQAQGPVGVHIDELGPHLPLRESPIHRLGAHPRGETFVQPQVVPPLHRYQVAKPHMRHFVGHHLGHPLPGAGRGMGRIHQQSRFPIGDSPPVFHRPGREVRDGNVIQLFQRIGNAEVIVEKGKHPGRGFQREPPLLLLAPGRPHRYPGIVGRFLLNGSQIPHHESQQVGGHNRGFGKPHRLVAGIQPGLVNNRRVGYRHHIGRDVQGQLKGRFARGFIPAGKGPAGVGSLELGRRQIGRFPLRIDILTAVKAAQLVIQLPGKAQIQLRRPGLYAFGKGNSRRFPFLVQDNGRGPLAFAILDQRGGVDGQFVGVQDDFGNRRGDFQVNDFQPVKGELFQVGLQGKAILAGTDLVGQNNGIGSGHRKVPPGNGFGFGK